MESRNIETTGLPPLLYFDSLVSTNDFALEMIAKQRPIEETAIVAGFQTHGKGQFGSTWQSEAGKNFLCSIIFYPDFLKADSIFDFQWCILNALYDCLKQICPDMPLCIKWPNDLYVEEKKLCGILMQSAIRGQQVESIVCGLGINVMQDFKQSELEAVSLIAYKPTISNPMEIMAPLRNALHLAYNAMRLHYSHDWARQQLILLNNRLWKIREVHNFKSPDGGITGTVLGVHTDGRLMIMDDSGKTHYFMPKTIIW